MLSKVNSKHNCEVYFLVCEVCIQSIHYACEISLPELLKIMQKNKNLWFVTCAKTDCTLNVLLCVCLHVIHCRLTLKHTTVPIVWQIRYLSVT